MWTDTSNENCLKWNLHWIIVMSKMSNHCLETLSPKYLNVLNSIWPIRKQIDILANYYLIILFALCNQMQKHGLLYSGWMRNVTEIWKATCEGKTCNKTFVVLSFSILVLGEVIHHILHYQPSFLIYLLGIQTQKDSKLKYKNLWERKQDCIIFILFSNLFWKWRCRFLST